MSNIDRNFRKALLLRKEQAEELTQHNKNEQFKKELIRQLEAAREHSLVLLTKNKEANKLINEQRAKIRDQRDQLLDERDTIKNLELKIKNLQDDIAQLKKRKYEQKAVVSPGFGFDAK